MRSPGPTTLTTSPDTPDNSTGKRSLAYAAPVADVFKALADPTRRTILDELTARDGQTLFELCGRLATRHGLSSSRQAISQHLEVLAACGLVTTKREGRYKFHFIDTAPLEPIINRWLSPPARTTRKKGSN
jgi:DNA-binding transcriptional ArsR family regulator